MRVDLMLSSQVADRLSAREDLHRQILSLGRQEVLGLARRKIGRIEGRVRITVRNTPRSVPTTT